MFAPRVVVVLGRPRSLVELGPLIESLGLQPALVEGPEALALALQEKHTSCLIDLDACSADGVIDAATLEVLSRARRPAMVLSSHGDPDRIDRAMDHGVRDWAARPVQPRELALRLSALLREKSRVVCLGGGTGLFTVLTALKTLPAMLLTSVVSMADDGGSSGRLRASFGILPPGDVRRSLVALSNAPEMMNHVMGYRFAGGEGLEGHNVGNLILAALADLTGDMPRAVKALGDILNVQGLVLCITGQESTLTAEFAGGLIVRGESHIDLCTDRDPALRLRRLWHEPAARCTADVYAALRGADLVILGPGDLYTSVIAGLVIQDVARAIAHSKAHRLYITNLMTKPGETSGYDAADHVREVLRYLGGDHLDEVLISSTLPTPSAVLEYRKKGQVPVRLTDRNALATLTRARITEADIGHSSQLVRHDEVKLRDCVERVLEERASATQDL
ncbi:MAG: uridine diphosphate-N-acetylglucosamine-binding protein YvcK [Myxococcota bacterium]